MVASATVQNGDESGTRWIPTFGGAQINHDFLRVPLMHSPAKTMWLRRFGTGDYSFFFVEGFDRLASPPDVEGQGKDQTSVANLRATSIAGEVPAQSRREGETTCEKRRRHAFGG